MGSAAYGAAPAVVALVHDRRGGPALLPHPTMLATGIVLGAVGLVATASLRPLHRIWVLPALVGTAMVVAPTLGLGTAFASWDVSTVVGAAAVTVGALLAGAAGAVAALRLGPTALLASLAGVAAAMVAGVPDTEGAVLLAGALLAYAAAPRVVALDVPPPAAAAAAVGVLVTGVDGATAGRSTGVGALGVVVVLFAAGGLRRRAPDVLPAQAAAPLAITLGAVVVARLTAAGHDPAPLAAAVVATLVATAAVLRVVSDRVGPSRASLDADEPTDRDEP